MSNSSIIKLQYPKHYSTLSDEKLNDFKVRHETQQAQYYWERLLYELNNLESSHKRRKSENSIKFTYSEHIKTTDSLTSEEHSFYNDNLWISQSRYRLSHMRIRLCSDHYVSDSAETVLRHTNHNLPNIKSSIEYNNKRKILIALCYITSWKYFKSCWYYECASLLLRPSKILIID